MINITSDDINVLHGKSDISQIGPGDNMFPEAGISFRTRFQNNLPFSATIVHRNGIRFTTKSSNKISERCFIIITEIFIRSESFNDIKNVFTAFENSGNTHLNIIKEAFYRNYENTIYRERPGITVSIETKVSEEDLRNNNGSIYLHNLDLVVSSLPLCDTPIHPYSQGSIQKSRLEDLHGNDISLNIHIIDNTESIGKRFIIIANRLHTLYPKRSESEADGIYIYSVEKNIEQKDGKLIIPEVHSLSECEKLGIYRTKEECISGGDIKTVRREALIELEHKNNLEKLNLENDNQRLKRELSLVEHERKLEIERLTANKLQREEELSKLQHTFKEKVTIMENERKEREEEIARVDIARKAEFAQLKAAIEERETTAKEAAANRDRDNSNEINRLNFINKQLEIDREREKSELERQRVMVKDYYENRSYIRRDSSEIVKWIPTMITAVIGIGALILVKTKT